MPKDKHEDIKNIKNNKKLHSLKEKMDYKNKIEGVVSYPSPCITYFMFENKISAYTIL